MRCKRILCEREKKLSLPFDLLDQKGLSFISSTERSHDSLLITTTNAKPSNDPSNRDEHLGGVLCGDNSDVIARMRPGHLVRANSTIRLKDSGTQMVQIAMMRNLLRLKL